MRSGTWPDTAVRTTQARAFLSGAERDLTSVSLTSEMTADFALSGGAGNPTTDGSVTWPQGSAVAVSVPQPFERAGVAWPPVTGSPLIVEVGDGTGQWWQQVTGFVDSSSGSLDNPQITSTLIDYIDRLSAVVWHDPLINPMPPTLTGGPWRRIGLTGAYVTNLVARAAGFNATPPVTSATLLSVSCMGSMWPEVGLCVAAAKYQDLEHPVSAWQDTDYGVAAIEPEATYTFAQTAGVTLTACLVPQPDGAIMGLEVGDGSGRGFGLRHNSADRVSVNLFTEAGGAEIVGLPRNGATRATVKATRDAGSKTLGVILTLSDGRTVSGSSFSEDLDVPLLFSRLRAFGADGAAVGAFLVETYFVPLSSLSAPVTARFRFIPLRPQALDAMPALKNRQALGLLTEQAQAQGSSFWIDSRGVLQWADHGILEAAPVKAVKSTDLTVDDFSWTDNLKSVRQQVVVKTRVPAVSRSKSDTVLLWQGQAHELQSDQVIEEWIEPATDVDWVQPDYGFTRIGFDSVTPSLGFGSKSGASYVDDNPNTPDTVTNTGLYNFSIIRTPNSARVVHSTETLPAGKTLVTQISNDVVNLPRNWRGMNLPLLRGKGRIQWSDDTTTYPTGGSGVGTYEHDAGWWVQTPTRLNSLRDWLLSLTTDPIPTVTSVVIDPDPRLEIGDKVTIRDDARTGIEFDLVLTQISQSWGGDRPTMSLAGRVTRITRISTITDPVSPWATFVTKWKAS